MCHTEQPEVSTTGGKLAAISKSRSFSTELRRSYIDRTLGLLGSQNSPVL